MGKRIRRGTVTVDGGAVAGVRDPQWDPAGHEMNWDQGDQEMAGDGVLMKTGPWAGSFELLATDADALECGYFTSLVIVFTEVEVSAGAENTADKTVTFYEDWTKLGRENARLSKPGLAHYGCSYTYSARAAVVCGVDGDVPGAPQALRWLDEHLTDRRQVLSRNPIWAIVPRKTPPPKP